MSFNVGVILIGAALAVIVAVLVRDRWLDHRYGRVKRTAKGSGDTGSNIVSGSEASNGSSYGFGDGGGSGDSGGHGGGH